MYGKSGLPGQGVILVRTSFDTNEGKEKRAVIKVRRSTNRDGLERSGSRAGQDERMGGSDVGVCHNVLPRSSLPHPFFQAWGYTCLWRDPNAKWEALREYLLTKELYVSRSMFAYGVFYASYAVNFSRQNDRAPAPLGVRESGSPWGDFWGLTFWAWLPFSPWAFSAPTLR